MIIFETECKHLINLKFGDYLNFLNQPLFVQHLDTCIDTGGVVPYRQSGG
jgi:hypothetical protein